MFLTAAGSVAGCVAMLRQGTKQGSPRNNIQCWTWRSLLRGCTSARSVGAASGNGSGLQPQAVRRSRMDGACPRSYGAPQLVLTARCAPTCIVTKALLHVDSCLTAFFKNQAQGDRHGAEANAGARRTAKRPRMTLAPMATLSDQADSSVEWLSTADGQDD